MATNNVRLWGQPVSAEKLPQSNAAQRGSKFDPLFKDVMLRLERTNNSHWLLYPFGDRREATQAQRRATLQFQKRLETAVRAVSQEQAALLGFDGSCQAVLAVRRGPEWK